MLESPAQPRMGAIVELTFYRSQYLVITLGEAKEATPVISKTLNPEWNQNFDLPITGAHCLLLEAVCWDKDRFGKDYMGQFDVMLDEIFADGRLVQSVCPTFGGS